MGRDLFDSCPDAARIFGLAGEDIKGWCFDGSKEELKETHVTQPTVFTVSMAAYAALMARLAAEGLAGAGAVECLAAGGLAGAQAVGPVGAEAAAGAQATGAGAGAVECLAAEGLAGAETAAGPPCKEAAIGSGASAAASAAQAQIEIVAMAGFSLGEYSALTAAGCIAGFAEGLALVRKRSGFMAEAGRSADGGQSGGMAAVLGERGAILACIEEAREGGILEAANYNSPGQTVAAGDKDALGRLRRKAKEHGLRAVPLNVSAAFHSSMMAPAAKRLEEELASVKLSAPRIKVYTNVTGRPIMLGKPEAEADAAWIRGRLARQVMSPVYWQETIENMANDGVELFIEVGPGETLAGLVRNTLPGAAVLSVGSVDGIEAAVSYLRGAAGA
jgi:[acyl-carrier-protein] S-malonyltransferase